MFGIYFHTLGCPKNQVDSEVMAGQLDPERFRLETSPAQAHIIVVNTCAFIQDAREESIQEILGLAHWKKAGACRFLVVAGCLVQGYFGELRESLPEVDRFIHLEEISSFKKIHEGLTHQVPVEETKPKTYHIRKDKDNLGSGLVPLSTLLFLQ